MSTPGAARLSVVVVTHDSREAIEASLPPLVDQLGDRDELIVVDNASSDGTVERTRALAPGARVIEAGENLGYGGGCNAGAAETQGELLLFLNPDAVVQPGFRDAIERPVRERSDWAAWQGLVAASDAGNVVRLHEGRVSAQLTNVNSYGGVVHFTGIAWADPGRSGASSHGWSGYAPPSGEVGFASGACLAIRRDAWTELGRFSPEFFLYQEDVDLSLRLRLAGHEVGVEPGAIVMHDYEFDKGPAKWRYLERNRWATIIRTYPTPLVAVLAPGLLATELALIPISMAGGWFPQKARATADVARALPRLLRERRVVQATRASSAASFARRLAWRLDSPYLGAVGRSRLLAALLGVYWVLARALLGRARPTRAGRAADPR